MNFTETNAVEPEIIVKDTPEKFLSMKDILVPQLIEFLRKLCRLEEEMYFRDTKIDKEKINAGIPKHIAVPESDELWKEYHKKYGEIAETFCTQKLLDKGYARSMGKPAQYSYINTGCKLSFIMKSSKRAVIETLFNVGIDERHKFVLRLTDDGWKIDSKSYDFNDDKWHSYTI